MDEHRFDALAKALAGSVSRRRSLKMLAAAPFGAVAARFFPTASVAPDCRKGGEPCVAETDCCSGHCDAGLCGAGGATGSGAPGPCRANGEGCRQGSQCCSGYCNGREKCACKPVGKGCADPSQCCSGLCDGGKCHCPGDQVRCDSQCCAAGQRCKRGRCVDECVPEDPAVTCQGRECGQQLNNCRKKVDCGQCPTGSSCHEGQCQPDQCVPEDPDVTCQDRECGQARDNCDKQVDCGQCPTGNTCRNGECRPSDPVDDKRTILASYNHRFNNNVPPLIYKLTAYHPRHFRQGAEVFDWVRDVPIRVDNPGPYAGWDVLPTIDEGVRGEANFADWLQLRLNRDATLAVVWRGGNPVPNWLNSWSPAGDVVLSSRSYPSGQSFPTFKKSIGSGRVDLGGLYNPGQNGSRRDGYWVLFSEADGSPSADPPVPGGQQVPVPNQTCPAWVHDSYVTTGPDGQTYKTWHNQIDPVYWCYFRHEHGSDPAHFDPDYTNAFGYTVAKHGMDEPHVGFKNITFKSNGVLWWVMIHFGTGGLARACARFHSLDVAARDENSGELLADLHLMADYGAAVVNDGHAPLTPPTCPTQGLADGTGRRTLPTVETGSVGYEAWMPDFVGTVIGLDGPLLINTIDPMVICNTVICDLPVTTGTTGTLRFLDANQFAIRAGNRNSGVFYTDPLGERSSTPATRTRCASSSSRD